MKKAFDSVSLEMLNLALRRIKILEILQKFIINLFINRRMRIITHFGLTEKFCVGDSIDQGEVISPLVWRIFYDPLLCRIQNDTSLGYIARATDFLSNGLLGTNIEVRQAVLAYADNTMWIASSKNQLKNIVRLAEQFFHFNDIEINGAKSKLAVINSRIPYKDRLINFSSAKILAKCKLSNIKFLGVLLHRESETSSIKKKLKAIVGLFIQKLKNKKIMASQMVYINN